METFEATVTSKGQVTLPAKLRSALGVKAGDKLVFRRGAGGAVEVEARTETLASLRGAVRACPTPVDGDQVAGWIEAARGARWRDRAGS